MIPTIAALRRAGLISPLDHRFAEALDRLVGGAGDEVTLAAALASRAVSAGHVCLDLDAWVASSGPHRDALEGRPEDAWIDDELQWPALDAWLEAIASSAAVDPASDPTGSAPLVLDDDGRLYLRRYFEHQERMVELLLARAAAVVEGLDEPSLQAGLDRLFGKQARGEAPDRQRLAAETAVRQRLTIVSGGPGTGKTSTVARLLLLILEQHAALGQPPPQMLLCAPTGKAATHLAGALSEGLERAGASDEARRAIPSEASTIHRCLRPYPGSSTRFRHDAEHPLPIDLLVVDEASMVDLALMHRLLRAVPGHARVVMLGDRDQLASVEAGAVLGDLCNAGGPALQGPAPAIAAPIQGSLFEAPPAIRSDSAAAAEPPLARCVVQLTRSYRYASDGGLGALARAINAGDVEATFALLEDGDEPDLAWAEPSGRGAMAEGLADAVRAGYRPYLAAETAGDRLDAMRHYRVLAAHRRGPFGVESLNRQIEAVLAVTGELRPGAAGSVAEDGHYEGRPIMLTRNDYELDLYNGDLGVVARRGSGARDGLQVVLRGADGALRWISPLRISALETVFAMSVHKSQGSEFDRIALVLPDAPSPVVTRELLYTGISRAREGVHILAPRAVLEHAVRTRVARASGLRERLWRGAAPSR